MLKTIRELYNEHYVTNHETALIKHYNSVLNKTVDELNESDICMLIRQEFFTEISIPKAIEIIKNNHAAGDNYEYCLLTNFAQMKTSFKKYSKNIKELIDLLEKDLEFIRFDSEDEKKEYIDSINKLKNKIS